MPALTSRPTSEARLTFDMEVRTASGAAVSDLAASQCRIRVDGKPVSDSSVTLGKATPEVVFVLDAVNTPLGDLVRSRDALLTWLREQGEILPDRTSVIIVSDSAPQLSSSGTGAQAVWELLKNELYVARLAPTRNRAQLMEQLTAYTPALSRIGEAQREGAGSERVRISLQALSFYAAANKDAPHPTMMLWISPGWPYVHLNGAGLSEQVFDSLIYFTDSLRAGGIVLSTLDPTGAAAEHTAPPGDFVPLQRPGAGQASSSIHSSGSQGSEYYRAFLQPVTSARAVDPNDMALPVLALHSGGTVQSGTNDLRGAMDRFAADAESLYRMTFPLPVKSGKGPYHPVDIDVLGLKANVRTQAGYYAR